MNAPRSPRRRWRTVAVVAGVLLVVLVAVELGARAVASRTAGSELAAAGIPGATVRLGSSWWRPTMLTALAGGTVDRVEVRLRDARVSGVQVASADYVLEDLVVDPDPFGGDLVVRSIGQGSFELTVAPEAVAQQLGERARIVDGRLVVGPDEEPAKLRVQDGQLLVESRYLQREGIDPRLVFIDQRLLPCEPEVAVAGTRIELACLGDRLPGLLDSSLGEPVGDVPAPTELEPPAVVERDASATTAPERGGAGG